MKNIISILFLIALGNNAFAQAAQINLSLNEAIETGLKNRYDVQANKYNLSVADNETKKNRKEWIPEIKGSGFVQYNPEIQSVYIPAGFGGSDEPSLITLGAKNNTILGLELNQPIYKPGLSTDIKIAENKAALEKEKNLDDENAVKEQIAKAYLNVLLKGLQNKIAAEDEQRYKTYYEIADGKMKLGSLVENDFLKAKLDYENAKVDLQKAQQNFDLATAGLKYSVNITDTVTIVLTDSIYSQELLNKTFQTQDAVNNRTEIKQYLLEQQTNQLLLSKARQNALPALSLYANYSGEFLNDKFNYNKTEWWTTFNYVGLKLSVPITANFKNSNSIKAYQLKSLQTDLNLKQETADINFEIQKATTELNNATQNMSTTKSNYDLSKVIYENQKQQYNLGSLSYSAVLDTDKSLNTAEQNYIKSVYDYLLSKINYEKAIGNL